jgi:hypothetical protein
VPRCDAEKGIVRPIFHATEDRVHAQRQRKKVEALFAELKNRIGLRRLRLRRLKFVREQFLLGSDGTKHQAIGSLPQPALQPGAATT